MMTDLLPLMRPVDQQDLNVWRVYWGDLERWIRPFFARSDSLASAMAYLVGLLSPAERKTSWQLAELVGNANPYRFQHLLGRASWDPDALRDALQTYITTYLGDPDAIGVLDETGFLKKGTHSVGVARQYSGTAGHIDNCQIGVFLTYASRHGHTMLDRTLYLPESWTDDPTRCTAAGVPDNQAFATKPALAITMLQRAVDAGVRFAWIAADSVYGDDRPLRQWLERRLQPYVMGITDKEHVWIGPRAWSLTDLIAACDPDAWELLTAGMGSQGPRMYRWQRVALNPAVTDGWQHWLLLRRSLDDPPVIRTYRAFGPATTSVASLALVVGTRWTVEESIQTAKGDVGLDHYEVRSWRGWHRHITLAMWAQALLAVIRSETGAALALSKKKKLPPSRSSLADFKTRRGLRSS